MEEFNQEDKDIQPYNLEFNLASIQAKRATKGYPTPELLEAKGGEVEWLLLRQEQIKDYAAATRNEIGSTQAFGLGVAAAGFLASSLIPGLAPISIGLGVLGYLAGCGHGQQKINRLLPIPFSAATLQRTAESISADGRAAWDDDDSDRSYLEAFLESDVFAEYEFLLDYKPLILKILPDIPQGKKFAAYFLLKEAHREGLLEDPEGQTEIVRSLNGLADNDSIDLGLNTQLISDIETNITTPLPPAKSKIEKLKTALPLDEIRQQDLLAGSKNSPDDLVKSISDTPQNLIICAAGGAGKGIVISNALREIQAKYPDYVIFYIDPKAKTKEKGYFEGVIEPDKYLAFSSSGKSPEEVVNASELAWKEYYRLRPETKSIVVVDECPELHANYDLEGKAKLLKKHIATIPNQGDADAHFIWVVTQNNQVQNLGINTGIKSSFAKLYLINNEGKSNGKSFFTNLKESKEVCVKKYSWNDLRVICDRSSRNRAFYWEEFDEWLPMPELKNYSGYDRDKQRVANDIQETLPSKVNLLVDYLLAYVPNSGEDLSLEKALKTSGMIPASITPQDLEKLLAGIKKEAKSNPDLKLRQLASKFSLA